MKNSYARVILPYENYRERVRNSTTLSPKKQGDPQLKTHAAGKRTGEDDESEPSSPLTATSSPLSEPPDEVSGRPRRNTRQASMEQAGRESPLSSSLAEVSSSVLHQLAARLPTTATTCRSLGPRLAKPTKTATRRFV